MQVIISIFNTLLLNPIVNLLVLIIKGLEYIHVPGELGIAIIILTALIRLIVWPVMANQLKSARKMAELKPHLEELKKKHTDKQELSKAQMALYKEHGINPAGGCLPLLIQAPFFIALVNVISSFVNKSHGLNDINKVLYFPWLKLDKLPDHFFLGLDLTAKPANYIHDFLSNPLSVLQIPLPILLIPIITGLLVFVQSKMAMPKPVKLYLSDSPKEKKEKESVEDAMSAMQGQMVFMMPLLFGYLAFTFAIGIALYYNIFTVLGIIQQYRISGWGGLEGIFNRFSPVKIAPTKK